MGHPPVRRRATGARRREGGVRAAARPHRVVVHRPGARTATSSPEPHGAAPRGAPAAPRAGCMKASTSEIARARLLPPRRSLGTEHSAPDSGLNWGELTMHRPWNWGLRAFALAGALGLATGGVLATSATAQSGT